ncbi:MAG: hypothetical protein APR63_08950 [Desulfuromonas sp. SDB]|nr:MAG: hypothetical protein APR63_08950 [Desulfuromonas sp. SDB]
MKIIKQICSYCKTQIGDVKKQNSDDEQISHGICSDCFVKVMTGYGESLDSFIDSLDEPILVMDEQGRVVTVNKKGQEMLSGELEDIKGHLGGDVFRCAYAKLPGGCGKTLHCQSCVVRRTVEETFKTGNPSVKVPACLDVDIMTGKRKIRFLISTKKIDGVVLLRIDDFQPDESGNL